jgi:uncharacterized protein (TIGR03435 family)
MERHLLHQVPAVSLLAAAVLGFGQTGEPLSFEVASLKPSPISTKDDYSAGYNAGVRAVLASRGIRFSGLRVDINDATLNDLVRLAYQVKPYQVIGPNRDETFDVAATMPQGTQRVQAPEMLRTLLAERFHLKIHRETRELPVYALVVAKNGPKLKAAVENNNIAWSIPSEGPIPLHARSTSMAGFADQLTALTDRPVLDTTGLTGSYDIDISYSRGLSTTSDDSAPALADALRDQLGLGLEPRKMDIAVWVIDSADRVPAAN